MPNYLYKCVECYYEFEMNLKIADRHQPVGEVCPDCGDSNSVNMKITAPSIGDPYKLGVTKPPSDFVNHVLGKVHAAHPLGNVASRTNIPKQY